MQAQENQSRDGFIGAAPGFSSKGLSRKKVRSRRFQLSSQEFQPD